MSKDPQAQAETKHTPWEVTETFWASLPGETKSVYCWNVQGDDLWLTNIRTLEQAHLIAASPDLLEALKAVKEWGTKNLDVEDNSVPYFYGKYSPEAAEALAKVDAAIAKAEKQP